jgi:hypothetical protein
MEQRLQREMDAVLGQAEALKLQASLKDLTM